MGRPELADDPRFRDISARTANVAELYETLAAILRARPTAEWLKLLGELEVPCAEVKGLEDLIDDPHLTATGFFTVLDDETGRVRHPGVPVLFDGERPPIRRPPRLGEHTEEVLREAGLSPTDVAALAPPGPGATEP